MMTMALLSLLADRVRITPAPSRADVENLAKAIDQRVKERGPSKLARRLRRKGELGLTGAF